MPPNDLAHRNIIRPMELSFRLLIYYPVRYILFYVAPKYQVRYILVVGNVARSAIDLFDKIAPNITIIRMYIADVRVRVYMPTQGRSSNAATVFLHGGGFVADLSGYDEPISGIVEQFSCVVFAIDYDAAPDFPYPHAIHQCERVVHELLNDTKLQQMFQYDPNQVVLFGESAGGNLSAVISQRIAALDTIIKPKCQVLVYPVVQMLNFRTGSYLEYNELMPNTAFLSPMLVSLFVLSYFGMELSRKNVRALMRNRHVHPCVRTSVLSTDQIVKPDQLNALKTDRQSVPLSKNSEKLIMNAAKRWHSDWSEDTAVNEETPLNQTFAPFIADPDVSPLLHPNPGILPPTLIVTAGYDVLRDDGLLYLAHLRVHGVPVQHLHYAKCMHGILGLKCKARDKIIREIHEWLNCEQSDKCPMVQRF